MNVNSGGPHILLFERDQQLVAILTSEFQLAGYECHAARTAVEVFDAIARYPIRLVLVNLAQAAAGRREFWVALDAQRRGRGVQVFTFRCMNLASYGSDDPDDRSHAMLADLDVDGMLGVMNLVDTIRSRISGGTTGAFSRTSSAPTSNGQNSGAMQKINRQSEVPSSRPSPAFNAQATLPLPSMLSDAAPPSQGSPSIASRSQVPASPSSSRPASSPSHPSLPLENGDAGKAVPSTPTFTDKIRAVIYPSGRAFSPVPETNWLPHNSQHQAVAQRPGNAGDYQVQPQIPAESDASQTLDREMPQQRTVYRSDTASTRAKAVQNKSSASGDTLPARAQESSLAQLSRMVREHNAAGQDEETATSPRRVIPPTPQLVQLDQEAPPSPTSSRDDANGQSRAQQTKVADDIPISTLPLRASPIQGIATESEPEYRSGQAPAQSMPQPKQPAPLPPAGPARSSTAPLANGAATTTQGQGPVNTGLAALQQSEPREDERPREATPAFVEVGLASEGEAERAIARTLVEQVQVQPNIPQTTRRQAVPEANATADDLLLNIVQSLPPMSPLPAASSQAQRPVLSGRATRSLGSVLLEGHLVPQHRLEVAQNIQRMLRGVDMNYQLGEILLMFKLLTPDQLLAASLVSYGLISATQISALGRIRQELHAIGLEYDLESLLVLFRILTPDQLREVRASWTT